MSTQGLKKHSVVRFLSLGPSVSEAKWSEEGKDSWGIQYTWRNFKLDRAFVMDDEEWIKAKNASLDIDIEGEMKKSNCPIYVAKKWANVPQTVEYPIEEVRKAFPNYFMNSIAYMFALAILEGYERIECYGIDVRYFNDLGEWIGGETIEKFVNHRNWLDETHCTAFWAGVAIGRGIEVVTTPRSVLMKPVFPGDTASYGYEVSPKIQEQRKGILESRKKIDKGEEKERLMVFRKPPDMSQEEFMRKVKLGGLKPLKYIDAKQTE